MDFKTRATAELCETPSVMHVLDPDSGVPLGEGGKAVTIALLGSEGRTYQQLIQDQTQRHIDALSRGKRRAGAVSAEANAKAEIDIVAACTKAWTNVEWEGRVLVCNRENAIKLYTQCPWLLAQAQDHMTRVENYLGN